MTLALLLLAGCTGPGGGPVQSSQSSPPIQDPNSPEAEMARAEARERALSPDYLRRRRQAIAELLEKNGGFGTLFHAKLLNARLAGPKVEKFRMWSSLITSRIEVNAIYCAKAQLDSALDLFARRTALIRVKSMDNGTEALEARVESGSLGMDKEPMACYHMEGYEPFPELEQVRARHRQKLGMTD